MQTFLGYLAHFLGLFGLPATALDTGSPSQQKPKTTWAKVVSGTEAAAAAGGCRSVHVDPSLSLHLSCTPSPCRARGPGISAVMLVKALSCASSPTLICVTQWQCPNAEFKPDFYFCGCWGYPTCHGHQHYGRGRRHGMSTLGTRSPHTKRLHLMAHAVKPYGRMREHLLVTLPMSFPSLFPGAPLTAHPVPFPCPPLRSCCHSSCVAVQ